jgi:hypothetical protein
VCAPTVTAMLSISQVLRRRDRCRSEQGIIT